MPDARGGCSRWRDEARAAKRGLWALDHWRVRKLDDLIDPPGFCIVEGKIAQVSRIPGDGEAHLDGERVSASMQASGLASPMWK